MTGFIPPTWLLPPVLLLAGFVGAAIIAALFSVLVTGGGPVDRPRERGSHHLPTPTSGGLAIIAATALLTGLIVWIAGDQIPGSGKDGLILFGFATLMGLSGAIDDILGLSAKSRLGFQIILCLVFAWFYRADSLSFGFGLTLDLWMPVSLLGSAAWLVLCINAINFMDGSNGLALGAQAIALVVIVSLAMLMSPFSAVGSYLAIPALICTCAAGAHMGFLPFNLPGGKAFQGDAGAFFAGALIGGVCLQLKAYNVGSTWFGGFLLAPLLVDVILTLAVRARKGRNLFQAHKEHLYQLWLQRHNSNHLRLALNVWGLCAVSAAIGLLARLVGVYANVDIRFPALVVLITILSAGWIRVRRELLRQQPV